LNWSRWQTAVTKGLLPFWINDFKDQAFHFHNHIHDQVIRDSNVKLRHAQQLIESKATINLCHKL